METFLVVLLKQFRPFLSKPIPLNGDGNYLVHCQLLQLLLLFPNLFPSTGMETFNISSPGRTFSTFPNLFPSTGMETGTYTPFWAVRYENFPNLFPSTGMETFRIRIFTRNSYNFPNLFPSTGMETLLLFCKKNIISFFPNLFPSTGMETHR